MWYLDIQVELLRETNDDERDIVSPHFRSDTYALLRHDPDGIDHDLNSTFQKQFKAFDKFLHRGSGWHLRKVIAMEVHTTEYKPLTGSTHFPVPKSIANSKAVISIHNNDDKCFAYAILAVIHPTEKHPERVSKYLPYEHELNMKGKRYPVAIADIPKIERQNDISVNVLGFEDKKFFPLYISPVRGTKHEIDLLYLQTTLNDSHYCYIKNLNRLLSRTTPKHNTYHLCRYCLQPFSSNRALHKHMEYCSRHEAQQTVLPEAGKDDTLQFRDFHTQFRVPYVIYCDLEAFSRPLNPSQLNDSSRTSSIIGFEACGFGYQVVYMNERSTKSPKIYRGPNVTKTLLQSLLKEERCIRDHLQNIEPIKMSVEDEICIQSDTNCHMCGITFFNDITKVRDHCDVTGLYRGAACRECNLNYRYSKHIPVILHNLKGFDSHLICETIGLFKSEVISCIPRNIEKYLSFSLGGLRFIDSLQFMNNSLEGLVDNLKEEGFNYFKNIRREFGCDEKALLLLRNGVYPYEYVDRKESFDDTQLPEQDAFYSNLRKSHISHNDYQQAQSVWKTIKLQDLGSYHDIYLKTDVLLLADCFERFRDICQSFYSLDPCHFHTAPGLSWQAALKMTKVKLNFSRIQICTCFSNARSEEGCL